MPRFPSFPLQMAFYLLPGRLASIHQCILTWRLRRLYVSYCAAYRHPNYRLPHVSWQPGLMGSSWTLLAAASGAKPLRLFSFSFSFWSHFSTRYSCSGNTHCSQQSSALPDSSSPSARPVRSTCLPLRSGVWFGHLGLRTE